jgi:TolB protein
MSGTASGPSSRRPAGRVALLRHLLLASVVLALLPLDAGAQWTNRYPRVEGYGHHVYLEGYELPTLSTGVMDPAPSPDGRSLAFTSRGWIWVLDLGSGTARRVTRGEPMDFRPAWSPDGRRLALVRDSGSETWIVVVDAGTGEEVSTVRSPAIELDPVFSPDGRSLYFSSAREGTLDLWRLELGTGREERLTEERGIQLRPQPHPDGVHLLYLSKAGGRDHVRLRNLETGEERVLLETSIASQARPALAPDGRSVAVNWPVAEGWELRLVDPDAPTLPVFLTRGGGLPLAPAWSSDGQWIYFSHPTPAGSMSLQRIRAAGGEAEEVPVRSWDWGEPTGRLRVRTVREEGAIGSAGGGGSAAAYPAPARLTVYDGRGHPAIPDRGQPRFDGEGGLVYFYSPGTVEVEVPAGEVTVTAVQGLATPAVRRTTRVEAGFVTELVVELEPLWDARAEGWLSGEHHFHLNYGGPFQRAPDDLELEMEGEAMEVATPLVANLHTRFGERELWGWDRPLGPPFIAFGQEVRSHFLGHVGLVGIQELFWPWIWGPGYPLYGRDDRPNADAVTFARRQGGIATYVHPVSGREPFREGNHGMIPVGFIPDAVLGDVDALEVVCLWSDDLGTAELWYRILNLGIPLAANAGSDVMTDFYRTMAIGTTRIFVRTEGQPSWNAYLDGLREGRSFVTTGPFLDFQVATAGGEWRRPGDAVPSGRTRRRAELRTPTPVERLELVVNGTVVVTEPGPDAPGIRVYEGEVELPSGGWLAARAHGGPAAWPLMARFPFAHASPVWIGERGSVDRESAARAAGELLEALDVAEARLLAGYEGAEIPRLRARFAEARERLRETAP